MRLSTSTNIHQIYQGNSYYFDACESIQKCAAAGYRVIDISLNTVSNEGGLLTKPDWKNWIRLVNEQLDKCQVEPSQAHALFYCRAKTPPELLRQREDMIRRCVEASGMLGVKWMVMHPLHGKDMEGKSYKEIICANAEYFKPYGKLAAEHGIGIAIENMFDGQFHTADDLLELVQLLDNPVFGICWDTGHANLTGQNQLESILKMGKTLKALHIADNNGIKDDHLAPYFGNIGWDVIVSALSQSGYEGDFTYEIHKFTKGLPVYLRDGILKFTWELGESLISRTADGIVE